MNEKLYLPLLATLGASFAIIGFQAINRYEKEQKQQTTKAPKLVLS